MTTKTDKEKPKEIDYNKRANIALGIGAFAVIVLPFLFSQFSIGLDFTETGQIGDTIGGITAPFVGLVGAFLVYYSFKQQMIANRIQIDSIKDIKNDTMDGHYINVINDLTQKCINSIQSFKIETPSRVNNVKISGVPAIEKFFEIFHWNSMNHITLSYESIKEEELINLNNCASLVLENIKKLSIIELQSVYLRLYEVQIHNIAYIPVAEYQSVIDYKHKDIDIYLKAKSNVDKYKLVEAQIDFSD
jgi:hypothetical protein